MLLVERLSPSYAFIQTRCIRWRQAFPCKPGTHVGFVPGPASISIPSAVAAASQNPPPPLTSATTRLLSVSSASASSVSVISPVSFACDVDDDDAADAAAADDDGDDGGGVPPGGGGGVDSSSDGGCARGVVVVEPGELPLGERKKSPEGGEPGSNGSGGVAGAAGSAACAALGLTPPTNNTSKNQTPVMVAAPGAKTMVRRDPARARQLAERTMEPVLVYGVAVGAGARLPVERVHLSGCARGGHLDVLVWARERVVRYDVPGCGCARAPGGVGAVVGVGVGGFTYQLGGSGPR